MGPQPAPEQTTGQPTSAEAHQQGTQFSLALVAGLIEQHPQRDKNSGEQHR